MLNIYLQSRTAVLEVDIVQIYLDNWSEQNNRIWKYRRKSIQNNTLRKSKQQKRRLKKLKITWKKWIRKLRIFIIICNHQCKNSWQLFKLDLMLLTKPREKMTKHQNPLIKKRPKIQTTKLLKFKLTKMFKLTIRLNKLQSKKIKIWLKNKQLKAKISNNWVKIKESRNKLQICWHKPLSDYSHK